MEESKNNNISKLDTIQNELFQMIMQFNRNSPVKNEDKSIKKNESRLSLDLEESNNLSKDSEGDIEMGEYNENKINKKKIIKKGKSFIFKFEEESIMKDKFEIFKSKGGMETMEGIETQNTFGNKNYYIINYNI